MVLYIKDNLFESPAKVLVNTVNIVGVMGRGIALTFKKIYPDMFKQYQKLCENTKFHLGSLWLYKTSHKWILNFPTKKHWRQPSKPEYIEKGLRKFISTYSSMGITSIAFPQLGCGNGELDWETVVHPLMKKYLLKLPIDIFIYIYDKKILTPEHKDIAVMSAWLRTEPRMLAFEEMWLDLSKTIGDGINLTMWEGKDGFRVALCNRPERGLFIKKAPRNIIQHLRHLVRKLATQLRILNDEDIFIPEESILDLWQTVREYGFCVPRIMPAGLDILARCVLPIFSKLEYMKKITLTRMTNHGVYVQEEGLQLFPQKANNAVKPNYSMHTVQPA
jgi:O-acetyl-ADP-ribose deacetylase (regulator of RNase III)